jgi:hypothetical protein
MKFPRPPRWSRLRDWGNSTLVQLTVLIPVIGYLIIFNEQIAKYLELIKEVSGSQPATHGLSVSPRLLSIYFGLCLIAFGAVIYGRYRPIEITNYGSSTAFVGDDGPNVGSAAHRTMESVVFERYPEAHGELAARLNRGGVRSDSREQFENYQTTFLNDLMHLYFDAMDESLPWLRGACRLHFGRRDQGRFRNAVSQCLAGSAVLAEIGHSRKMKVDHCRPLRVSRPATTSPLTTMGGIRVGWLLQSAIHEI